mmetsp:Transcript_74474/g.147480  ORF Transcript_74474/g.147480 Transcript_74474/m.147480 type:complete len:102 (-) Transcript_74474:89-394(-)
MTGKAVAQQRVRERRPCRRACLNGSKPRTGFLVTCDHYQRTGSGSSQRVQGPFISTTPRPASQSRMSREIRCGLHVVHGIVDSSGVYLFMLLVAPITCKVG